MKQMNPNGKWRHEDGSVRMLKYLLKDNHINTANYGLDATDETFIYEIISGTGESKRVGRSSSKFYLYDIVNNSRSGHSLTHSLAHSLTHSLTQDWMWINWIIFSGI